MAKNDKASASTSDFVEDPIFGAVPKDTETMLALREQAAEAGEPDPTVEVPLEIREKVTDK